MTREEIAEKIADLIEQGATEEELEETINESIVIMDKEKENNRK